MPPASILVAEDQADIRELLVMNLRSAGYEVGAVADGAAALARQIEQPADLLVLDLMMPGLDGLEVTKALRARGRSTPILMLTAKSTELDRVLGLELGADDYLTKPFSLAELLARVKALLRRADLLRVALLGAQRLADFEPVEAGHHQVEDQQVARLRLLARERRQPVADRGHRVAGAAQVHRDQLADIGLVLGQQDGRHAELSRRRAAPYTRRCRKCDLRVIRREAGAMRGAESSCIETPPGARACNSPPSPLPVPSPGPS
jgi:DNA-binding response OmpR family regulator